MTVDEFIQLKLVHEVHTSERKSFKACRRRWDWIFRQNYYPQLTAKPLEFGSAYHVGMETFYNPDTWDWDAEVRANLAVAAFTKTCEEQKRAALRVAEANMFDVEVEQDYEERVALGRGMLLHYFTKVSPIEDRGFKPVKVEIAFMVAVPNVETGEETIWCKCDQCKKKWDNYIVNKGVAEATAKSYLRNAARKPGEFLASTLEPAYSTRQLAGWGAEWQGLPVVYAGRIDMLAQDDKGRYWIFDWKTARSLTEQIEFLYLDDQIGSYVWALRKIGLDIRGFVYHEQKKAFPQKPSQNVNRRLGRLFSVSKNQETDYATYLATVMSEDTDAYDKGLYTEFLEFLLAEGIKYYYRRQIPKSEEELLSIEHDISLEVLDMLDPKLRIYPSAGRFGCGFCAFRQPCMEKNSRGDFQYMLDTMYDKREHYYVRQQASTESKGAE